MSHGGDDPKSDGLIEAGTPGAAGGGAGVSASAFSDQPGAAVVPGAFARAEPTGHGETRGLADGGAMSPVSSRADLGETFEKSVAGGVSAASPAVSESPADAPSAFDMVEPDEVEDAVEVEPPADAVDPWGAQVEAQPRPVSQSSPSPRAPIDFKPDRPAAQSTSTGGPRVNTAPRVAPAVAAPIDEALSEASADEESDGAVTIEDEETEAEAALPMSKRRGGGVLTIPLICVGVAIIACVTLLPLADENHRLAWEREKLRTDLAHLKEQARVNDEFLQRVADDPTLAERLAQRQMRYLREGTKVLQLRGMGKVEMSPFHLVSVPPPPPMTPYQPVGGPLAALMGTPRAQLYASGVALLLIAMGLVLGYVPKRAKGDEE